MKIATSPYQLNYLRQEVKMFDCHLLRSFSDNFYEESLDRVIGFVLSDHQRQTCAHKLQTTVDVWMPWENSMRKGISPRKSQQVQYFDYARKRSGTVFMDFENPTLTTTTMTSGWPDSEIHYGLAFPLSQYVFPSLVLLLKRSCSREIAGLEGVGRDWSGVSAFVLCENT